MSVDITIGDIVSNGWAGKDNPTKVGIVCNVIERRGMLNPGKHFVFTDFKGEVWEMRTDSEALKKVGRLDLSEFLELQEEFSSG